MHENSPMFNRFELKYLLSWKQYEKALNAISAYCEPDLNGNTGGVYLVSSLYYDTDGFLFYSEKDSGIGFRRKLRLRI